MCIRDRFLDSLALKAQAAFEQSDFRSACGAARALGAHASVRPGAVWGADGQLTTGADAAPQRWDCLLYTSPSPRDRSLS
eukprot:7596834-Pyramimonas_sp.AAC.1